MGSLISAERFVVQYARHVGDLPPSYYHNAKVVVHGQVPEVGQMAFFLNFGDILGEESPWGKAVYHIPLAHREDVKADIHSLLEYAYTYRVDLRQGRRGKELGERVTILGSYADDRGRPIIEVITGHQGRVEKINFTRRDVVQKLQLPPPSENILYLRKREKVPEPVLV